LSIQVPDGHQRKVAIGTLQEEVLAVPTGSDRRHFVCLLLKSVDLLLKAGDVLVGRVVLKSVDFFLQGVNIRLRGCRCCTGALRYCGTRHRCAA
jgi:hypothetical protein